MIRGLFIGKCLLVGLIGGLRLMKVSPSCWAVDPGSFASRRPAGDVTVMNGADFLAELVW
jgi:hypothetical protein